MSICAVRGATTAEENSKEEIIAVTQEMVSEIIGRNDISADDIIDMIFTVTDDLTKVFPAASIRKMGITDVPLLDMAAPHIDGALDKCVRVMIHYNTDRSKKEIHHVYLRGAKALRPDIVKKET